MPKAMLHCATKIEYHNGLALRHQIVSIDHGTLLAVFGTAAYIFAISD